jgi:hypothetical protein
MSVLAAKAIVCSIRETDILNLFSPFFSKHHFDLIIQPDPTSLISMAKHNNPFSVLPHSIIWFFWLVNSIKLAEVQDLIRLICVTGLTVTFLCPDFVLVLTSLMTATGSSRDIFQWGRCSRQPCSWGRSFGRGGSGE